MKGDAVNEAISSLLRLHPLLHVHFANVPFRRQSESPVAPAGAAVDQVRYPFHDSVESSRCDVPANRRVDPTTSIATPLRLANIRAQPGVVLAAAACDLLPADRTRPWRLQAAVLDGLVSALLGAGPMDTEASGKHTIVPPVPPSLGQSPTGDGLSRTARPRGDLPRRVIAAVNGSLRSIGRVHDGRRAVPAGARRALAAVLQCGRPRDRRRGARREDVRSLSPGSHVCTGTGLTPCHICGATGLTLLRLGSPPAVPFAPARDSPPPHLHHDWACAWLPHLRQDWARPATSALGMRSPPPPLPHGWAHF